MTLSLPNDEFHPPKLFVVSSLVSSPIKVVSSMAIMAQVFFVFAKHAMLRALWKFSLTEIIWGGFSNEIITVEKINNTVMRQFTTYLHRLPLSLLRPFHPFLLVLPFPLCLFPYRLFYSFPPLTRFYITFSHFCHCYISLSNGVRCSVAILSF